MKKQSNKYIALIIFLLVNVCMTTTAQTSAEFKKLICKDWKVNFYELNGEKLKVSEEQQNAVIQYNANNTMTMSQVTVVRHGNWVYDEKEKIVTVDYVNPEGQDVFHVIKIDEKELILEINDMNRGTIRFNFLIATK